MLSAHSMMDDKAFAIITKDSVRLMAESGGHSCISDSVAVLLGEDVSYRLRETVMKSAAFMKNAKRRRLSTEDFNHALRNSDVQPVFGHGSASDSGPFRLTREGELHFVEDTDIILNNSVCNSYIPKSLGRASVKGQWIAVEGVSRIATFSSSHSQITHKNPKQEVPAELMSYYNQITQALFGSHAVLVKWALADLSTNPSVTRLLPYLVNFVANGVKAVSHDVSKLTVLIRTVESLVRNQALFLETQPYLNLLVQSLESCLLEPLAAYINQQSNDHWMLRQLAAEILAEIIRKWGSAVNHLHLTATKHLGDVLGDKNRPLCSHFGAVLGLRALGPVEVKKILVPQLDILLPWLDCTMNDLQPGNQHIRCDAVRVHDAILVAVEEMLKSHIDDFLHITQDRGSTLVDRIAERVDRDGGAEAVVSDGSADSDLCGDLMTLYQRLYGHFGDAMCVRLPVLTADCVTARLPAEEPVCLGDADSQHSGHRLLADLLQQVDQHHHRGNQHQAGCLTQRGSDGLSYSSSSVVGQSRDQVGASGSCKQWVECDVSQPDADVSQQVAVSSSTISDPTKGTLKLKIKRQPQGRSSPPVVQQTLQSARTWAPSGSNPHQHRKRKQPSKTYWEHEVSDRELVDPEEMYGSQMCGQPCFGGESSESEASVHRKGNLRLKLKVPCKESVSD